MRKTEALLLSLGILTIPLTAEASQVQTFSAREAMTGLAPVINVCPGVGFNLSFLEVKGGITRAWLDDPTQIHVSFDTGDIGKSPAKIIHLKRINKLKFAALPQGKHGTLLSVVTTARQLYRFRVAYGCPSRIDTGIVQGAIAARPRIAPRTPRDPVIPKPAAKVTKSKAKPKSRRNNNSSPERISFANQLVIEGDINNLYGLKSSENSDTESLDQEVSEVPPSPKEPRYEPEQVDELQNARPITTAAPVAKRPKPLVQSKVVKSISEEAKPSPSKVAWHLTRGLHKARVKGEINYGTRTYRQWQSVIARIRRGQDLESAIKRVGAQAKVGAVLLNYGGLK